MRPRIARASSIKVAAMVLNLVIVCFTVANVVQREQHQCSATDTSPKCQENLWTLSNRLTTTEAGTHDQQEDGSTWQLQFSTKSADGTKKNISPWHDIPLYGESILLFQITTVWEEFSDPKPIASFSQPIHWMVLRATVQTRYTTLCVRSRKVISPSNKRDM